MLVFIVFWVKWSSKKIFLYGLNGILEHRKTSILLGSVNRPSCSIFLGKHVYAAHLVFMHNTKPLIIGVIIGTWHFLSWNEIQIPEKKSPPSPQIA